MSAQPITIIGRILKIANADFGHKRYKFRRIGGVCAARDLNSRLKLPLFDPTRTIEACEESGTICFGSYMIWKMCKSGCSMSGTAQTSDIGDDGRLIVTTDKPEDEVQGSTVVDVCDANEAINQAHLPASLPEVAIECMHTMLAALNVDTPVYDILNMVAVQSRKWLGAEEVIIGKQDADTQTLTVCAADGPLATTSPAPLLTPGIQALRRATLTHAPVMYTYGGQIATGIGAALPAVLAVPLANADNIVCGGLLLFYDRTPQLSAPEMELATLLGAQAMAVMGNSARKVRDYTNAVTGERNRIARDLHDSVTQALYTISLITETLPAVWQSHHEEARQSVETLHTLARSALAEMRTLLLELRPIDQADSHLGDLLRQLPDRMRLRSKVQIATTIVGDRPLPKHVQVALYYIAQEALNNVDKHACASRASIQLDFRPNGVVVLCVSDNGRGINPATRKANQLGLNIMRERAVEVGATFAIESRPGQGTRVVVEWHADH